MKRELTSSEKYILAKIGKIINKTFDLKNVDYINDNTIVAQNEKTIVTLTIEPKKK